MDDNLILIEKSQGIATVTMNRPDALNALSGALRQAIAETFDQLREDTATEVIIPPALVAPSLWDSTSKSWAAK